ncbi:MAG: ImmA/IrrE family metallo-endopeptidase, partial [Actinomycetes bacterium]
ATTGIDVLSMAANEAEHGLSTYDPDTGARAIVVATTGNPMRQRSSVAHELGHFLAGDLDRPAAGAPGQRTPAEIQADAFARHLLLPLDAVRARVRRGHVDRADLSALVQNFEVSPQLAAIQLKEARRIDGTTCEEWGKETTPVLAAAYGWLSQYSSLTADSRRPRAPQKLMAMAVSGYQHRVLGFPELAGWYGEDRDELERVIGSLQALPDDLDLDPDAPLFAQDPSV